MRILVVFVLTCLTWPATTYAKTKNLTDPVLTCGVIGQLIQDMALGLGPVIKKEVLQEGSKLEVKNKSKNKLVLKKKFEKSHQKSKRPKNLKRKAFRTQTYRFKGSQMWGSAEVAVVTAENGFDARVKSDLPVTMWSLYADDGTMIESGGVKELKSFKFFMEELYYPPYTLTLNVTYMGMPNQIKIKIGR